MSRRMRFSVTPTSQSCACVTPPPGATPARLAGHQKVAIRRVEQPRQAAMRQTRIGLGPDGKA